MNRTMKEIWSWTRAFGIALVAALLINTFLLQTYKVQGQSMMPTVHENDYAVIYKMPGALQYGDIVIVDSRIDRDRTWKDGFSENALLSLVLGKQQDEHLWIKRVIGKPGDKLEFTGSKLYRNGELLDESYINEKMQGTSWSVVVEDQHLFVMGDNRNHSGDSRMIGAIPDSHIVGKVVLRN